MFVFGHAAQLTSGWQGSFCRQLGDSVDEFYNFLGDTIRVHIRATPVDSWIVVTDSSGVEVRATITAMGATRLNGITDSFREVTLQAYQNNMVTAHYVNGKKLRWTKAQGWVKTLDWYIFPYGETGSIYGHYYGTKEDSASYDRIDDTIDLSKGRSIADVQARYAPGNAWRTYGEDGRDIRLDLSHYFYFHDSVINVFQLGHTYIAQMQRDSCDFQFVRSSPTMSWVGYWQATPYSGILHTETITADSARLNRRQWIFPDGETYGRFGYQGVQTFLLTDTFCGRPQVCADFDFSIGPDGLGHNIIYSDNGGGSYYQNAAGLGNTANMYCSSFSEDFMPFNYSRLEYLKTAACTYGTYINVPALSVSQTTASTFSLFPNPTQDLLYIRLPDGLFSAEITLSNVQGSTVKKQNLNNNEESVVVGDLPAGLYLVRVVGKGFSGTQKVVIAR